MPTIIIQILRWAGVASLGYFTNDVATQVGKVTGQTTPETGFSLNKAIAVLIMAAVAVLSLRAIFGKTLKL